MIKCPNCEKVKIKIKQGYEPQDFEAICQNCNHHFDIEFGDIIDEAERAGNLEYAARELHSALLANPTIIRLATGDETIDALFCEFEKNLDFEGVALT